MSQYSSKSSNGVAIIALLPFVIALFWVIAGSLALLNELGLTVVDIINYVVG